MRFLFSLIFLCFVFYPNFLWSKNYIANYKIKTNGIVIGALDWNLKKSDSSYLLNVELKSKGLLSKLFSFKGSYKVVGEIYGDDLVPLEYSQFWKTNKKERDVKISFKKGNVVSLIQYPIEKEFLRIDTGSLKNYSDPLTSFLKLLNGSLESKTIDGRRVYTFLYIEGENGVRKYIVKNFTNLWADHKRNDLDYISFESGSAQFIPRSIYVSFKGRLFKVLID